MLWKNFANAIVSRLLTVRPGAVLQLEKGSSINAAGLTISAESLGRAGGAGARVVPVAAATLALTQAEHDGKVVNLNRAAGTAVTLEPATGSGASYRLIVGTTITSNATTVKVANSADVMAGVCIQAADGGTTCSLFEAGPADDTISFNGSTTGGVKGDLVELVDLAVNTWWVRISGAATGTEATPFGSTV